MDINPYIERTEIRCIQHTTDTDIVIGNDVQNSGYVYDADLWYWVSL